MSYLRPLVLALLLLAVPLIGQQVTYIDLATETQRIQLRYPASEPDQMGRGVGGSIGDCGLGIREPRSLTISIEAVFQRNPDSLRPITVQFKALNSGQVPLELPISPHLADLQPEDASAEFHYSSLALSVSPVEDRSSVGFVELYGKRDIPGSVITLNPGEWIRVEATLRFLGKPLPQGELHLVSGYWLRSVTFHPHPGGYSTASNNDCLNSLPTPSVPFERR